MEGLVVFSILEAALIRKLGEMRAGVGRAVMPQ